MDVSKLWRWLQSPEPNPEEIAEVQEERRKHDDLREKVIDQYYEEGFPSQEAVKGFLWFP